MEVSGSFGILALLPIILALVLAFWTKNSVFSILMGCIVGVVIAGFDPATGLMELFQSALGSGWFIWVLMIEVFIGIMIASFQRAGVIETFAKKASKKIGTRRGSTGFAWFLGVFCFFSDYFSPLFSGPIARPLTDENKVSREKLSYILDSTSAPVPTLIPLSGWAVYIAGLLVDHGPIADKSQAMTAFVRSIPYNFYAWIAIILAALFAFEIIPDFGPMKKAEDRAHNEGKLIRDGGTPMAGKEIEQVKSPEGKLGSLTIYLFIPVAIVVAISLGTFFILNDTRILTAFISAVIYLMIALAIGGFFDSVDNAMDVAQDGIKGVLPAVLILSLAFCINEVTQVLGGADYIISITKSWMTPAILPGLSFIAAGIMAFLTGTSWGTYGILFPFVMPIAFSLSGGAMAPVVFASIAAVTGGGAFGDHCSPVSDTTILSSLGAGSDHIDHVTTQIPYALSAGILSAILFLVVGVL